MIIRLINFYSISYSHKTLLGSYSQAYSTNQGGRSSKSNEARIPALTHQDMPIEIPGREGGVPILGHTKDVRPEWVSFRGPKTCGRV